MSGSREPLFLARETYRRRRLMDAARILPVAGLLCFAVPLLWNDGSSTALGWLYLFVVWLALIAGSFAVSRRLIPRGEGERLETGEGE